MVRYDLDTSSLRAILATEVPTVNIKTEARGNYGDILPIMSVYSREVRRWARFNFIAITDAMAVLLKDSFDPMQIELKDRHRHANVAALFDGCHCEIVNEVISYMSVCLRAFDPPNTFNMDGFLFGREVAEITYNPRFQHQRPRMGRETRKALPHWCAKTDEHWLLVGYTVNDLEWHSEMLRREVVLGGIHDDKEPSGTNLEPLRHLGHNCWWAQTKYGFIVTPQELVVVMFHLVPDQNRKILGATWQSIPLRNHGQTQLTPCLSLLALMLMSLGDAERGIAAHETGLGEHVVDYRLARLTERTREYALLRAEATAGGEEDELLTT